MQLYSYDRDTYIYTGEFEARLDPLESKLKDKKIYAVPPYTTKIEPIFEEGKVTKFNKENNQWELLENHLGTTVYNKKTGGELLITELGPIPEGYVTEKPYVLQEDKAEKIKEVDVEFNKAQNERIVIGKVEENIEARANINSTISFMGDDEKGVFTAYTGTPIVLTRDELNYISNYLYVRNLLLVERRNEIVKKLKKCRTQSALKKLNINFDILKETEELAKKTKKEINEYFEDL